MTDDVSDAIAARVDALDYERMLGDQLRAELPKRVKPNA